MRAPKEDQIMDLQISDEDYYPNVIRNYEYEEESDGNRWFEHITARAVFSDSSSFRGAPRNKPEPNKRKPVKGPDYTELKCDTLADEENGESTCIICLANRRCCVTQPCMHLYYCVQCSRHLVFGPSGMELKSRGEVTCPGCRVVVKKISRVHL